LTIGQIKQHPWFSQCEYAELFEFQFTADTRFLTYAVDDDAVALVRELGVDTRQLADAVRMHEYTETTAMYYMMKKALVSREIRSVIADYLGGLAKQEPRRRPPIPRVPSSRAPFSPDHKHPMPKLMQPMVPPRAPSAVDMPLNRSPVVDLVARRASVVPKMVVRRSSFGA